MSEGPAKVTEFLSWRGLLYAEFLTVPRSVQLDRCSDFGRLGRSGTEKKCAPELGDPEQEPGKACPQDNKSLSRPMDGNHINPRDQTKVKQDSSGGGVDGIETEHLSSVLCLWL